MKLWDALKGPRFVARKVKFIYEPYRKAKVAYVTKKRNQYLKEKGAQLVLKVGRILEKTTAQYFVCAGTLLGIVREGKLIDWDLDVDFGIFLNDDYSWADLEKTLYQAGFSLDHQFRFKEEIVEQTYRHEDASIDFYRYFSDASNSYFFSFYKKKDYVYERENQVHTYLFKIVKISGTKDWRFDKGHVRVPNEINEYFIDLYGENWRIPDPNWVGGSGPACMAMSDAELGTFERFS